MTRYSGATNLDFSERHRACPSCLTMRTKRVAHGYKYQRRVLVMTLSHRRVSPRVHAPTPKWHQRAQTPHPPGRGVAHQNLVDGSVDVCGVCKASCDMLSSLVLTLTCFISERRVQASGAPHQLCAPLSSNYTMAQHSAT